MEKIRCYGGLRASFLCVCTHVCCCMFCWQAAVLEVPYFSAFGQGDDAIGFVQSCWQSTHADICSLPASQTNLNQEIYTHSITRAHAHAWWNIQLVFPMHAHTQHHVNTFDHIERHWRISHSDIQTHTCRCGHYTGRLFSRPVASLKVTDLHTAAKLATCICDVWNLKLVWYEATKTGYKSLSAVSPGQITCRNPSRKRASVHRKRSVSNETQPGREKWMWHGQILYFSYNYPKLQINYLQAQSNGEQVVTIFARDSLNCGSCLAW